MNWDEIDSSEQTKAVLSHWQKLGQFRQKHPAMGAGIHQMITEQPYYFYRSYQQGDYKDLVVIGIGVHQGAKAINVSRIFEDGTVISDAYSGQKGEVKDGRITITSDFDIVLLEVVN